MIAENEENPTDTSRREEAPPRLVITKMVSEQVNVDLVQYVRFRCSGNRRDISTTGTPLNRISSEFADLISSCSRC